MKRQSREKRGYAGVEQPGVGRENNGVQWRQPSINSPVMTETKAQLVHSQHHLSTADNERMNVKAHLQIQLANGCFVQRNRVLFHAQIS